MSELDVVRAWKDPAYRASLSEEDLSRVPPHPAGLVELTDTELKAATGLSGIIRTTNLACTMYSFRGWGSCCP